MRFLNYSVIGGIMLLALNATNIWAQDGAKVKDEVITFSVTEQPFAEIIDNIKRQYKVNIEYKEDVADILVTIELIDVPWRGALDRIAKKYQCKIKETDGGILEISKPPTVTMELEDADIRDVINYIAQVANENIVYSNSVEGKKVSLRLKNVSWEDALNTIVKNSRLVLVEEEGNIRRVVDPREIETQLETEIFPLRYIRPKDGYSAKITGQQFTSAQASSKSVEQQVKGKGGTLQVTQFSLLTALNAVVTKDKGRITYDETTNTLIISDVRPKIEKMKQIIKELDREPKQVFVDVKFVRTTNDDVFGFGIDPGASGITVQQTFGALSTRFPFTLGRGGFEDKIAAISKADSEAPSAGVSPIVGSNPVSAGVLNFGDTSFALRLFKSDKKTKIIQAPKLITLDNHEATIFVGESISFATSEIQQNDNGSSTIEVKEAPNSPAQQGFQMLVIPHTLPDTNKLQMTIVISNDQLIGSGGAVSGFNRFTVAGVTLDLPASQRQVIVTHLILESNQTAVIGGLMKITQSEEINKVPFLGDIPFLGYFFKHKTITKQKEDMYVFLTPQIIQTSEVTRDRQKTIIDSAKKANATKYKTIWEEKEKEQ